MRYKLLGDILNIKSALLYKRGYVDTEKKRNPVLQINIVKTNDSNYTSFMEYNFKFDIDKGPYSSHNPYESLDKYSSDLLIIGDESNGSSLSIDNMIFQVSNSSQEKNYSVFELYSSENTTNILIKADSEIQKIEFYSYFMNNQIGDDGFIEGVTEYDDQDDSSSKSPVLIIEFGPEESYEIDDYYNKEDIPIKPEWSDDEEIEYQKLVDEYYNDKFVIISMSSLDSNSVNISLSSHISQTNPHRSQNSYVVSNSDLKLIPNIYKDTLSDLNNVLFDKRSFTLIGNKKVNKDSLVIYNDLKNLNLGKISIEYTDELGNKYTKDYDEYKDYVVYNKDKIVYYKGKLYRSLINGNLYEDPSISPMWIDTSVEDSTGDDGGSGDGSDSGEDKYSIINIRVNDQNLGTTDPLGPTKVKNGLDLVISIYPIDSDIRSVYIDGTDNSSIVRDNSFTISNILENHDVLVEFSPIYRLVTITENNSEYGHSSGSGLYKLGSDVVINAYPNEGYEFLNWTDNNGDILSTNSQYTIINLRDNIEITANFIEKKCHVIIESSTGGTFTPYNGNPSDIEVEYNGELSIVMIPKSGYEIEYVSVDSVVNTYPDSESIRINNITSDHNIYIKYSRPRYHVIDPILGRINYSIVGDQIWSVTDLSYVNDNIGESINGVLYYSGEDLKSVSDIVYSGGTGFRIPSRLDICSLYDFLGEKESGRKLKSSITSKFDKYGWNDSIYRGLGMYGLNFIPYGYIVNNNVLNINIESRHWTSSYDESTNSNSSFYFLNDSPSGFLSNAKLDNPKMRIRLMGDAPKVEILGKKYRYITISLKLSLLDKLTNENIPYMVTQNWIIDNLDYDEIGVKYENSSISRFGSLYSSSDLSKLSTLISESSEFRVPTNEDFIILEKFLGYNRDKLYIDSSGSVSVDIDSYQSGYVGTTEGKRLKAGDLFYSDTNWNGYSTNDIENSQMNVLPSGYGLIYDDGIDFLGMGTEAKFWTSTNYEGVSFYYRSMIFSDDRIFRGSEYGGKSVMSVRLVNTKYVKL